MGNARRALVLTLMFLAPILFAGVFASSQAQGFIIVPLPIAGWQKATLDSSGGAGWYPSIAVDNSGKQHVSYYDSVQQDLKYATNAQGNWTFATVDSIGQVGLHCSLALDPQGKAYISYYDLTNHALKFATNAGGTWTNATVDRQGAVGQYTSIALDSTGKAFISYYDVDHESLKIANNTAGHWVNQTVDDPLENVGLYSHLAIDAQNKVHIAYFDSAQNKLKYVTNMGGSWAGGVLDDTANAEGKNDMALNSTGAPRILFWTNDRILRYASCDEGVWTVAPVAGAPEVNGFPSMVIDQHDATLITYQDFASQTLHYAVKGTSTWYHLTVDLTSAVGYFSSIGVDANDKVHIVYEGGGLGHLLYATNAGAGWYFDDVDTAGSAGTLNAIAVDTQGTVHISYADTANGHLMYAKKVEGSGWTKEVADQFHGIGELGTSIAVDSSGRARIAYSDASSNTLKFATNEGGTWINQTIASGPAVLSSIVLDADGHAHVFYYISGVSHLKYATNKGGSWDTQTIDNSGTVSGGPSALIDKNGKLHVLYFTNTEVKHATDAGGSWVTSTVDGDRSSSGSGISLTMDSLGHLHAVYYVSNGGYLIYNTNSTGTWQLKVIEGPGFVGGWCSVGVGSDRVVRIAYQDNSEGRIRYMAKPEGIWMKQTLGVDEVGSYGQMALDRFGRPWMSFYDYVDQDLRAAQLVTLPSGPAQIAGVRGDHMVEVTWLAPANKGGAIIGSYRIFHGTNQNDLTLAGTVSGSTYSYTETGLTNGVRMYYAVAAVNVEGQGARSAVISSVPATLPSQPLNLKAVPGAGQVQLSWDAPSSTGGVPVTMYKVYRGTVQTSLAWIANVTTGTSYTDRSVENGKTYYYHVTAVNDVGEGANSTTVSASPTADDTLLLVGVVALVVLVAAAAVYVFMRRR